MDYLLPADDEWHCGTFIKTPSYQCVEILGSAGLDFGVLDAEHAPFDRAALDQGMVAGRAAGLPLFVRVCEGSAAALLSVLDMGAAGVLVPHVDTPEQARQVVANCRYMGGGRGFSGSPRAHGYGALSMKEALARGDRSVVIAQIESVAGVHHAAAIAATEGLEGVFIGRADLALSMGLDTPHDPRVDEATERVIRAGVAAGKLVGMFINSQAEREKYFALGVRWFVHGSDQSLLRQAAQAIVRPGRA